jgi:hypothetical protein
VINIGRNGLTAGIVNPTKREVQCASGVTSREPEIVSDCKLIAAPGDAGLIVTNAQGKLVGMLFALTPVTSIIRIYDAYRSYPETCRGNDVQRPSQLRLVEL